MKVNITLLLAVSILLAGCSQQPSYDFMVDNFNENKPTFSMIATIACDIGEESGLPSYAISGDNEEEKTLLELADRVNVEAISFKKVQGNCQLSMPVWDGEVGNKHQQFTYRYNLHNPKPYDASAHRYQQVLSRAGKEKVKTSPILFDMKLSKRWFFSFIHR